MGVCAHVDVVRRCAPSTVAAVIHAASDQVLRQPEQTDETGCDDQQVQDSSCESGVKNYSARDRATFELLASEGMC